MLIAGRNYLDIEDNVLSTKKQFDRELHGNQIAALLHCDVNNGTKSVKKRITINIEDIDDHYPFLSSHELLAKIENQTFLQVRFTFKEILKCILKLWL